MTPILDQYGPRAPVEAVAHLHATHSHAAAQYARQVEALTTQITRLHQALADARHEITWLTGLMMDVGAQLHDGPELETP
jgi:ribulose-5-phosphate 4-epimerase/fuculose-1-phosphate aldolase